MSTEHTGNKNPDWKNILAYGIFLGVLATAGVNYQIGTKEALELVADRDRVIKSCEHTIPRNRHCKAVWLASIVSPKTTLVGKKGTNTKDIVVERKGG